MQHVEVYVKVSGDYCAFHEMSFRVLYDITNNISLGKKDSTYEWDKQYTLEELENWSDEYSDVDKKLAVLVDGKYYMYIPFIQ